MCLSTRRLIMSTVNPRGFEHSQSSESLSDMSLEEISSTKSQESVKGNLGGRTISVQSAQLKEKTKLASKYKEVLTITQPKDLKKLLFDKATGDGSEETLLIEREEGTALIQRERKNKFSLLLHNEDVPGKIQTIKFQVLDDGKVLCGKLSYDNFKNFVQEVGVKEILVQGSNTSMIEKLFDPTTIIESRKDFIKRQEAGTALLIRSGNIFTLLVNDEKAIDGVKKIDIKCLNGGQISVEGKVYDRFDEFIEEKGFNILTQGEGSEADRIRTRAEKDLMGKPVGSIIEYSRKEGPHKRWQKSSWVAVKAENGIELHEKGHASPKLSRRGQLISRESPRVMEGANVRYKTVREESGDIQKLRGKLLKEGIRPVNTNLTGWRLRADMERFEEETKTAQLKEGMERKIHEMFQGSENLITTSFYKKGEEERLLVPYGGASLEKVLTDDAKVGEPINFTREQLIETLNTFKKICVGEKEMHDRRVVHFDLKPGNIVVDGSRVRLIDFGESYLFPDNGQPEEGNTNLDRGTQGYVEPFRMFHTAATNFEEAKAMDIYSSGRILLRMLLKNGIDQSDINYINQLSIQQKSKDEIFNELKQLLEQKGVKGVDDSVLELIAGMLAPYNERPPIDEVIQSLDQLLVSL